VFQLRVTDGASLRRAMLPHLFLFAFYRQLQTSQFGVRPTGVVLVFAACVQDGVEFVVAVNFVEQPYNVFAEFIGQRTVFGLVTFNIDKCTANRTLIPRNLHAYSVSLSASNHAPAKWLMIDVLMWTVRANVQSISTDLQLARNSGGAQSTAVYVNTDFV
jgi:hypothetical protein